MDKAAAYMAQRPMALSPAAPGRGKVPAQPREVLFSQIASELAQTDGVAPRDALILELRNRIACIVTRPASGPLPMLDPTQPPAAASMAVLRSVCPFSSSGVSPSGVKQSDDPLTFGIASISERLPGGSLSIRGLHEFKPRAPRDSGAALALTFALAGRRTSAQRPLLLVLGGRASREHGLPYGPGLRALGLNPDQLIIVSAPRAADALWALEEGLRSRTLGSVIGLLDGKANSIGLLPARRLVLAADAGATPCLLLTDPNSEGLAAAHTRWRVGGHASAQHPLDARAPGAWRCALTLERSRHGPSDLSWMLEWCDASHSFSLAAQSPARALAAHGAGRGTG